MNFVKTLNRDEMKQIMAGGQKIQEDCGEGEFECTCNGETSCESSIGDCYDNC